LLYFLLTLTSTRLNAYHNILTNCIATSTVCFYIRVSLHILCVSVLLFCWSELTDVQVWRILQHVHTLQWPAAGDKWGTENMEHVHTLSNILYQVLILEWILLSTSYINYFKMVPGSYGTGCSIQIVPAEIAFVLKYFH